MTTMILAIHKREDLVEKHWREPRWKTTLFVVDDDTCASAFIGAKFHHGDKNVTYEDIVVILSGGPYYLLDKSVTVNADPRYYSVETVADATVWFETIEAEDLRAFQGSPEEELKWYDRMMGTLTDNDYAVLAQARFNQAMERIADSDS